MTVGKKLEQTLANLQSVQADLKSYALETEDAKAQNMFNEFDAQLNNVVDGLMGRLNYVKKQEPQYDMTQQIRNALDEQDDD